MLAFYLAQSPPSARASSESSGDPEESSQPPNPALLRQARGWFAKALEINTVDEVAAEFVRVVSFIARYNL